MGRISGLVVILLIRGCLADILINEVNCDNPSSDTAEFVELWNPDNCSRSLDGYTLVFFNGHVSPVLAYRSVNLSGYCVERKGYFVIGSSSVTPTPDIVAFGSNGIQNGLGNADAIALYKNYHVPSTPTRSNLVDAIIYDITSFTGASGYFPSLMSVQTPVHEDDTVLGGDESMSRCGEQASDLSAITTGALSPGADNFCFLNVSWTGMTDCSAYIVYNSELSRSMTYSLTYGSKVTDSPFSSRRAGSSTECAQACSKSLSCYRFSFSSSVDFLYNCLLNFVCQDTITSDQMWMVGTKSSL